MIILKEDFVLRAIEEEDLDLLRDMINDPDIENMTGGSSFPVSRVKQKLWFDSIQKNENELRLIIDTKEHGSIGLVMLTNIDYRNRTAEFHSKITTHKNLHGKGYGTKATQALVEYGFNQLNLHCIYSRIIEYNIASQRVKEKCGFIKDGILRDRIYKNGKYFSLVEWSITQDEFINAT